MSECYNCDRLQEKYDNIRWRYDNLLDKYNKLEKDYNNTYDKLSSAEFKIHTELEPRIKQEQRSYDNWVTSGGRDVCFGNGNCGYDCLKFGSKPECFENVSTEEEILDIYENYVDDGYILDLIEEYGLEEKVKEIDKKIIRNRIDKCKDEIKKLEEKLLNI